MMQLPVPPAKMTVKIKGKNKTVDLINEGEANLIKDAGLTEISFDARFQTPAIRGLIMIPALSGALARASAIPF